MPNARSSAPNPLPRRAAGTVRDLRGGVRLLTEGVRAVIGRVESAHQRVVDVEPPAPGVRLLRPGSGVGSVFYRGLRGTADLLGGSVDFALASLQASLVHPHRDRIPLEPSPAREALVAALNAVAGDHLHRTDNPLATELQLKQRRTPALPRVLVLVHDLGLNDLQWRQRGHDHGEALADALGLTPVYALYNSGRHVAATGRELASELQALLGHWPVPLADVALLGHGMGGLVLRSALYQAQRAGLAWPQRVSRLVFLGTPHGGADLARGTDLFTRGSFGPQTAVAPLARLSRRRSHGMEDFLDGRWLEQDARAGLAPEGIGSGLPPGVEAYAIAGATADGSSDGMVPVASALGRHPVAARDLQLPEEHRWAIDGVDHLGLLASEAVFQKMRQWLSA